jgi:predicted RNA polymerase sigma factor
MANILLTWELGGGLGLAPELPGLRCALATAMVLHRGIEAAKQKAHRAWHNQVDLQNLPLPSMPGDPSNWITRNAREHLEQIIKKHFRKTVSARSFVFEQLGAAVAVHSGKE